MDYRRIITIEPGQRGGKPLYPGSVHVRELGLRREA
jgi:uncharacterized protein (DUF433 family)